MKSALSRLAIDLDNKMGRVDTSDGSSLEIRKFNVPELGV